MKIIIVTGGNRGIGFEICRQLDALGHKVIMGSRSLEQGLIAARSLSDRVHVLQLDVTCAESVNAFYKEINAAYDKADVLINNAGIGSNNAAHSNSGSSAIKNTIKKNLKVVAKAIRPVIPLLRKAGVLEKNQSAENVPMEAVKTVMETNFYGAFRMMQAFIPLLQKSPDGRIINISSGMGELQNLNGTYPAYSLSKAALNALTVMFSRELAEKGISVNAMCPGWVRTDMGGPDAPRSVAEGADTAVWLATEPAVPTGKFFRDRKEVNW